MNRYAADSLKDLAFFPTTVAIAHQDPAALYRHYDRLVRLSLEPLRHRRGFALPPPPTLFPFLPLFLLVPLPRSLAAPLPLPSLTPLLYRRAYAGPALPTLLPFEPPPLPVRLRFSLHSLLFSEPPYPELAPSLLVVPSASKVRMQAC